MYGRIPLFPPSCSSQSSMQMPVFDGCGHGCGCEDCQTVRIFNPACRDEYVDVELCVDGGGNLSICVRRPPRPCPPRHCPPRRRRSCDCSPWFR